MITFYNCSTPIAIFSLIGTVIRTAGCVLAAMQKTSVKPYILVMGITGFIASVFGARNLGVWVTRTYKFDTAELNAAYLSWVETTRAADASAAIGSNTAATSTTNYGTMT